MTLWPSDLPAHDGVRRAAGRSRAKWFTKALRMTVLWLARRAVVRLEPSARCKLDWVQASVRRQLSALQRVIVRHRSSHRADPT